MYISLYSVILFDFSGLYIINKILYKKFISILSVKVVEDTLTY